MRTRNLLYGALLIVATSMLSGCLWRDDGYRGGGYHRQGDRGSVNWEGGGVHWEGGGDHKKGESGGVNWEGGGVHWEGAGNHKEGGDHKERGGDEEGGGVQEEGEHH